MSWKEKPTPSRASTIRRERQVSDLMSRSVSFRSFRLVTSMWIPFGQDGWYICRGHDGGRRGVCRTTYSRRCRGGKRRGAEGLRRRRERRFPADRRRRCRSPWPRRRR
ncbi:hypothetical protein ACFFX0_21370 [Citricoccus parietis]|uniref:Uncharacterized protein n=1 Tax=Citricoccus parietis TaxID=592307 RepID=A0ABV5G3V5_9MICC